MPHLGRIVVAPRWLLPILALLLVLGHACELPAVAAAVTHHGEGVPAHNHDAAAHGHGDGHEADVQCDPMDAASASAAAPLYGADAYAVPTLHGTVRATTRSVVAASDYRWHPPDRPPLFLLHAALLI